MAISVFPVPTAGGGGTNLVGPGMDYNISLSAGAYRISNSHALTLGSNTYAAGETVTYIPTSITSATLSGAVSSGLTAWGAGLARGFDAYYGNGLYFLGGSSGNYYTSTDQVNWTTRTLPAASTILGVTYGNGLWAVVTGAKTLYTSPDAITWTLKVTIANDFVNKNDGGGIVSDGTGFIAPTQGPSVAGGVVYSTDGITWTNYSGMTSSYRSWSGYAQPGLWIIGSDSGRIHYSTNSGSTWTQVATGASGNIYGIAKHNGLYVFATGGGGLWTSPTGISSFTSRSIGAGSETLTSTESTFGFVWVESNSGSVYKSPDGISWSNSGLSIASDTTMRKMPNGELVFVNGATTTYKLGLIANSALATIESLGEVLLPNA